MLERGQINGEHIWVRSVEVTGGERIVLKEAPQIDGATVEAQGQEPLVYRVEFQIVRDNTWISTDVEIAAADLRAVFLLGGPFEVELPGGIGVVSGLWLDQPWSQKPWDGVAGVITGTVSFVDADPFPEIVIDLRGAIDKAILDLSRAIALDFGRRAPEAGYDGEALAALGAGIAWLNAVADFISTLLGPVTDTLIAGLDALSNLISTITELPYSFAAKFIQLAAAIMALIAALSQGGSSATAEDDSIDDAKNVLVKALKGALTFDDGLPSQADLLGDDASDEDIAAKLQKSSVTQLVLSAATMAACYAAKSVKFSTADAVGEFAAALQPVVGALLESESVDYRVYAAARYTWLATIRLLAEESARLPRLATFTVRTDTDALSLVAELYPTSIAGVDQLEAAVAQLLRINVVPDPTSIPAGTVLRVLQGAA